jgi:hypothetical protein
VFLNKKFGLKKRKTAQRRAKDKISKEREESSLRRIRQKNFF